MARRRTPNSPEEESAEVPRSRRKLAEGPGGAAWFLLIATVLLTGVAVVGRLLQKHAQQHEPGNADPAPQSPDPAAEGVPMEDPFAGFVAPEGTLKKSTSSGIGRGGSPFSAALRLSSDPDWTVAVERARRAFELLEQAGQKQNKGADWRTPAREARELLQQALESTEAFEERLASIPSQAQTFEGVRAEREVWRRREYEVHRLVGG
jgi:hypothetical protein